MRWLSKLAVLVILLSVGTLLASVPIEKGYEGRAVMAQRVQVDQAAKDLFGDSGENTPIGSPQMVIVDDPKAFLPDQAGVRQLDEGYLQKNCIYPLQLKTVRYVASMSRLGAFAGLVAGLLMLFFARKRPATSPSASPSA